MLIINVGSMAKEKARKKQKKKKKVRCLLKSQVTKHLLARLERVERRVLKKKKHYLMSL